MSGNINTRRADVSDIPTLLEMVSALAAHHGDHAELSSDELTTLAFSDQPWITLIVAEFENQIAGYAALCPLIQLQWGKKGMDVHHLFVKDTFRKRGIGSRLIDAAVNESLRQGCSYITVGTHPDNTAAQMVYQACGFRLVASSSPRFRREINCEPPTPSPC